MSDNYVHGYSPEEQQRLVEQSERWNELIPHGLNYQAGQSVLEIGCAAGTTLGILAQQFPGIKLAGIDFNAEQINFATQHLTELGLSADLRIEDANHLSWEDESFDHIFIMWFVEHLDEPLGVLAEASRVLKPGGSISLIETDYSSYQVAPRSADYDCLNQSLCQLFDLSGNAVIGREIGALLHQAGFSQVINEVYPLHFIAGTQAEELRSHVEYTLEFIEPMIPDMVEKLNADQRTLEQGVAHLRSISARENGALSHLIYKAIGIKQ
ncbi:MAG: SAM-dependent methyltransferase [Blastopirellula sp.]|nr:MAG: SAM-dependent methyltransferase [Blastopirellula sp.]